MMDVNTPPPVASELPLEQRQVIPHPVASDDEEDEDEVNEVFGNSSGLGAHDMIRKGSPTHHQAVIKLHVPYAYQFLPTYMQRWIMCTACLAEHKWLAPKWKVRYLILTGNYLYRYKNEYSTTPKGMPILVEHSKARMVIINDDEGGENAEEEGIQFALDRLPVGTQGVFAVQVYGPDAKTHYYGVPTVEDARVWVQSLQQSKQEAITTNLGHSKLPQPKSWAYYNKLGDRYVERKERIKARIAEYNTREMEMTAMSTGVPLSDTRGVYS
jgi:hypothetical protein